MAVVGLGAWCDYEDDDDTLDQDPRTYSIRVEEFAVLADGRRLTLRGESPRGYRSSLHTSPGSEPVDVWAHLTLDSIEADVRTTVLPDGDDTQDEHPWEWLAERIRAQGVDVRAAQLTLIPYEVEFSDRLRARVHSS